MTSALSSMDLRE
jgi:hypothetical protein